MPLDAICRTRPSAAPRRSIRFDLPATVESVPLARRICGAVLAVWRVDAEEPCLVLTELAANAAEHGGGEMAITLKAADGCLHIEVVDSGAAPGRGVDAAADPFPTRPGGPAGAGDESGRGLGIVAALAQSSRLRRLPDGSTSAYAALPQHPAP
ncbi:ATP-binding protein [Streptomyces sp. NPDC004126]|uniref:ATP-binding protein n=1 Tax=Streptomyces sp. NPDC004126 TaxID=3390695 RepID=UPI003D031DD1